MFTWKPRSNGGIVQAAPLNIYMEPRLRFFIHRNHLSQPFNPFIFLSISNSRNINKLHLWLLLQPSWHFFSSSPPSFSIQLWVLITYMDHFVLAFRVIFFPFIVNIIVVLQVRLFVRICQTTFVHFLYHLQERDVYWRQSVKIKEM